MLWLLFPELFSFSLFPAAACLFCSSSEAFSLTSDLHAHSSTLPWDEKPEDPMHPQRQTNHSSQQKAADLLTLAAARLHAAGCPHAATKPSAGEKGFFKPRRRLWKQISAKGNKDRFIWRWLLHIILRLVLALPLSVRNIWWLSFTWVIRGKAAKRIEMALIVRKLFANKSQILNQ